MKLSRLLQLIALSALSTSIITPCLAIEPAAKRKIFDANKNSVFGLKGVLKITAAFEGQARVENAQIWSNATNIGKGLLVAAYTSISPNFPGQPNVEIAKEISQLKLINGAGEEFDAKLVLHDEDLGLAFIAVDPKGKKASQWKDQIVDISVNIKLDYFDETINISRYAEHFGYEEAVTVGTVSSIQKEPRILYQILNSSMSAPSFDYKGRFVGITISKTTKIGNNQSSTPVTIPARYIRKFLPIAIKSQAALTK